MLCSITKESEYVQFVDIFREVIRESFDKWSKSSRGALIFKDRSPNDYTKKKKTDFDIFFAKYAHGDREAFDGYGGIIAHSGYPREGLVHFDGSEFWSINGRQGLDFKYVGLNFVFWSNSYLKIRNACDQ